MPDSQSARIYVVCGRVQGVGFRYFVERAALGLGLTGYVKNRTDTTVEIYAAGSPGQLDELERHLWSGPSFSRVDHVEGRQADPRPLREFRIED